MPLIVIVAATALVVGLTLLVWSLSGLRSGGRDLVASNLLRGDAADLRELVLQQPTGQRTVQPLIAWLSRGVRRHTPAGSVAALERKLMLAGRPPSWPLDRILAAKLGLPLLGTLLGLMLLATLPTARTGLLVAALVLLLYVTPDVVLSARARERQRAIVDDLPDSLDQMTICVQAGLGFEAAMARAGQSNQRPLAQELVRTLQEMQVGVSRTQALRQLSERCDARDLRHFVTAVLQAENYGVPIVDVLQAQASELRRKRRQRAEEAARKLPLKLLFPLIFCFLPTLFVIILAPAVIQLVQTFSNLN